MAVGCQPTFPVVFEIVAGAIVDDQEDLASASRHDLLEEFEEREAVEHGREPVVELRPVLKRDDAEDVRRLAHSERVYTRLAANSGPRLVKRSVEPEAGFVAEEQGGLAFSGFFLAWDRCIAASDLARPDRL